MTSDDKNTTTTKWTHPSPDSELVIGLVAPFGTELGIVIDQMTNQLQLADYDVKIIHVSKDIIPQLVPQNV